MASEQVAQLEQARQHVLADAVHYPDIINGIVPIIGSHNYLETQRWGAEFLAEAFASPMVNGSVKEKMSLGVLAVIKDWLDNQSDEAVVKSAIQAAASIYPYIFRYVTNNQTASAIWDTMTSIKLNVTGRFDTAPMGIRIVCIKFVQRVVLVQTPGIIADPRRPEQNEISSALVPRDHPIIPLPKLEAEASGLLDRLLRVFQESSSDAIVIDATLNCLSVLVRTRQTVSNKIISAVLSYNPFKNLHPPLSAKDRVQVRSIERTTRAFLFNANRRREHSQFESRIAQYCERIAQSRRELEGQAPSKKRGPPEPTDGLDDAKRQKFGASAESRPAFPPMPRPPLTLAQVFALTSDSTGQFDVKTLPVHLVQQISLAALRSIPANKLTESINAVRARLLELDRIANEAPAIQPVPQPVPVAGAEEDEEYEPEFEPVDTLEQIANDLDAAPPDANGEPHGIPEVALRSFKLPRPDPISPEEAEAYAKSSVGRVFSMIENIDTPAKPLKAGLNRLAGSHFDNDAWVTLITRLATRAPSNLDRADDDNAQANGDKQLGKLLQDGGIADNIRETLFKWVITDFRHRISVAISWLNEEWYNEQVLKRSDPNHKPADDYDKWTLRLLDSISPYLDAKDKSIMRFLSEIPALSDGVFRRVKNVANDPDRAGLAVNALHYLVVTRPPARQQALDALEDLYKNYQGAAIYAKKVLLKWRREAVEPPAQNGANAVKEEASREETATPVNAGSAALAISDGSNGNPPLVVMES